MKKRIEKITAFIMCFVVLFCLSSCEDVYFGKDVRQNLNEAGYSVFEYTPSEFNLEFASSGVDAVNIVGLTSIYYAEFNKNNAVTNICFVFIFDTTENAENVLSTDEISFQMLTKQQLEVNGIYDLKLAYGQYKNIIISGTTESITCTGINLKSKY